MTVNDRLAKKLQQLPRTPGVYFHKSRSGEVIYVGKAAVLKNRVRQYFQKSRLRDVKTDALVAEIADTDWIEVESEIDALFLESEMVKRYMPRYNILLRDDKSQIYVRINMKDEWPHVDFTRHPADDGADYYGPYYNAYAVKKALRYLRKTFPHYTHSASSRRSRLDSQIGLNPPPDISSSDYKSILKQLIRYLKGDRQKLVTELEKQMKHAAARYDFEAAARHRNQLANLRELKRRIMFSDREFLDISKDRALSDLTDILGLKKPPVRIEGYDISHMSGQQVVASMVVFSNGVSDRAEYRKFKMHQQRNDDYQNMYDTLHRRLGQRNLKSWGTPDLILIDGGKGQLQAAIRAQAERGTEIPVISIAKREEEIIVHRLYSHIDLTALETLSAKKLPTVAVITQGDFIAINLHLGQHNASAHSRNLRAAAAPSPYDDVIKLFQRIRDESHRFAVSYHTVLKRQRQTASSLEQVPGIGPATRKKLIKQFGSLRGVKAATEKEVADAVGKTKAAAIKNHLPAD